MITAEPRSWVKQLVITFAHMLIIGEPLQFEAVFSFPEEIILPEPPAPQLGPIRVLISEIRRKRAWAVSAKYPVLRYHNHELNYIEEGDFVIIPSTKRHKTCYYKVQARTGSRLDLIETTYLPRITA